MHTHNTRMSVRRTATQITPLSMYITSALKLCVPVCGKCQCVSVRVCECTVHMHVHYFIRLGIPMKLVAIPHVHGNITIINMMM